MEEVAETGALGVGCHRGLNFEGEGKSVAALARGDMRRPAGAYGVEEGLDFEAQGLAGRDLGLDEGESWRRPGGIDGGELGEQGGIGLAAGEGGSDCGGQAAGGVFHAYNQQFAARVVDGDVLARLDGQDGGVEAFQVAGLQDPGSALRAGYQVVGFVEGCGEGLLDQQIEAGIEEHSGDGAMLNGRHRDAGGVQAEIGAQQLFDRGEDGNAEVRGNIRGTLRQGLHGSDEGDAVPGVFQLTEHAQVIAAEGAGAGDGHAQIAGACYCAASLSGAVPWTARRQRP